LRIAVNLTCAMLALMIPIAARADLKGTQTLAANTAFSFDTGATSATGGDMLWSGTSMTPQGKATAGNVPGFTGAASFALVTQSILQSFGALFTSAPIPASTLVVNDIFAVKTNGGNYGAALVTAVSGTSITIQYITFGVSSTPSGPTVTSVINNFSYTPAGFSNSGIAPGTLFLVIGSGLADPAAKAVLQSSAAGLPNTLNGASVKVVDSSGATVTPPFYYAISNALALVLPSNTKTGTAQLTVTFNGQTSAAYSFQVTTSEMGFDSYDGSGTGLAVATNPVSGALYNYNNSIAPGTTVVLWGSGLGADSARDNTYLPAAFPINNLAHLYVGGVEAQILYQGASGFPGVNQVNVTISPSTPTGCAVSLAGVTADGTPTNFLTLPIGTGACSDPVFGPLGGVLQTFTGSKVRVGALVLEHTTSTPASGNVSISDSAVASFSSFNAISSATSAAGGIVSLGSCSVTQLITTIGGTPNPRTGLDAGTITVKNPAGTSATLASIGAIAPGVYTSLLPAGFITSAGGAFPFHGAGGADVGAFDATVNLPNPALNWTNQSTASSVTRSAGLPLTWTGGAAGSYVTISGGSASADSLRSGSFICTAPVAAGQFTVPSYVLAVLPAGNGTVTLANSTYSSFTAPGIDVGLALGSVSLEQAGTFK